MGLPQNLQDEIESTSLQFDLYYKYEPKSGDFNIGCMMDEMDDVISYEPQIIIKRPSCSYFGYKSLYYTVKPSIRWITMRDVCASLERDNGQAQDDHHIYIERLDKVTNIQYNMECGS